MMFPLPAEMSHTQLFFTVVGALIVMGAVLYMLSLLSRKFDPSLFNLIANREINDKHYTHLANILDTTPECLELAKRLEIGNQVTFAQYREIVAIHQAVTSGKVRVLRALHGTDHHKG